MATKDFENKCAKSVKRVIEVDSNYERPAYQTCLTFVRRALPALELKFPEGTPHRGAVVQDALVELARAQFRKVR